MLTANMT